MRRWPRLRAVVLWTYVYTIWAPLYVLFGTLVWYAIGPFVVPYLLMVEAAGYIKRDKRHQIESGGFTWVSPYSIAGEPQNEGFFS